MEHRITDQIRAASQAVAQRARYVRIDLGRLAEYARTLPIDRLAQPQLDGSRYYLGRRGGLLNDSRRLFRSWMRRSGNAPQSDGRANLPTRPWRAQVPPAQKP